MKSQDLAFKEILANNHAMNPKRIAGIRLYYRVTQVRFAEMLGVKLVTFQKWEQGVRNPSSPAAALLYIAENYPEVFIKQRKLLLDQLKNYIQLCT